MAAKGDPAAFKAVFERELDALPPDPEPVEPEVDREAAARERAVSRCAREGQPRMFGKHYEDELAGRRAWGGGMRPVRDTQF